MNEESQAIKRRPDRNSPKISPRQRLMISYVAGLYNWSFSHVSNVFFGYKDSAAVSYALSCAAVMDDAELEKNTPKLLYRQGPAWRRSKKQKRVVCYCPRCEKHYTRDIFWTGRGEPRLFCPECRYYLGMGEPEEYLQKTKNLFRNY